MSASQSGVFSLQEFTDVGAPLVAGRLYTYTQGTTTHKTAYTDKAGSIAHTYTSDGVGGQYIGLNARGELPAPLYLAAGSYDITLKDSTGATIWTRRADPVDDTSSALAADLASTSDASKGAGMVKWFRSIVGFAARWVSDKLADRISVKDFGAVGDGLTDDTAACQAAINWARDGGYQLVWPNGQYRITSQLVTQHDGSYKQTNWIFEGGVIVADFSGSPALYVTGGSQPQIIKNITIQPSTAQQMNTSTWANRDTTSHGISVVNSVVDVSGTIQNFRGHGYVHSTSALNSNCCKYDLLIQSCNIGFYASGTNDNYSVVRAGLNIYNCAQSGFYADTGCPIRQWTGWIYSEANCQAVTATAAVYAESLTKSKLWIYSEQQNAANEIDFSSANCQGNRIDSARFNKDTYANGNLVFYGGDIRKNYIQTWTPTIGGSTTAGVQTYSTQKGYWLREGNKVTIWGVISLSAKDAATAGNLRINGLPINPASSYSWMVYPIAISEFDNITVTAGKLGFVLQAQAGNSFLAFSDVVSAGVSTLTPSSNLSATSVIVFSGTYLV